MALVAAFTQSCKANENVSCTLLHALLENVPYQKIGLYSIVSMYTLGMLLVDNLLLHCKLIF
jgi:hypothetical protein